MTVEIKIRQPDDWHLHLRDHLFLQKTVFWSARYFHRAIIMPNLTTPVTTASLAVEYKQRIQHHIPPGKNFSPLMTLYLTDDTSPEDILEAKKTGDVYGCKLYPAGVTTNSQNGVLSIENLYPAIEAMIDVQMPLLIHGEILDTDIDIFDREKYFIEYHLDPLMTRYPELKIVLEHITTEEAVDFVQKSSGNLASTITPQHLLYHRNHLLSNGLSPHLYCLPILKRRKHQEALRKAATSGCPKFFLGTDSAPHTQENKESACGCAGCFSAYSALELYAVVFEQENALDKLEGFASFYGADFYGLPRNKKTIVLRKKEMLIPKKLLWNEHAVIPLKAGKTVKWSVDDEYGCFV